jgi:hypothetical protein
MSATLTNGLTFSRLRTVDGYRVMLWGSGIGQVTRVALGGGITYWLARDVLGTDHGVYPSRAQAANRLAEVVGVTA